MKITIPDFCLLLVVGTSGSGDQTLAQLYFSEAEIIAAKAGNDCKPLCGGASGELEDLIDARLRKRLLTVVDADVSAIHALEWPRLAAIAKSHHAETVAIIAEKKGDLGRLVSPAEIKVNGIGSVHRIQSGSEMSALEIDRVRLPSDLRSEHGPFDIIGDVHGCVDELSVLLNRLGYEVLIAGTGEHRRVSSRAPAGRRVVFVGDLVDRGPASPDVLRIVMHMVREGQAIAVPGNHDVKLLRWMDGQKVRMSHGLAETISQLNREPDSFRGQVHDFIEGLASHAWLEGGRLAVAHAGIKEEMIGRMSGAVREFCLHGETSGETDEFGLPIRYHWAAEYRGATAIVYGHTPVPEAEWFNNTLCIDTGCVFGGKLTALRWPEGEIVSVPASRAYAPVIRPFAHPPPRPGYSP